MNIKEKLRVMDEIDAANKRHVENWKQANKIRGILVDVVHEQVSQVTIDKKLQAYYDLLNCRCIDIVHRRIGAQSFEIICDGEGADSPKISAINHAGTVALLGNLFIVGFDGVDDVRSLTDAEVTYIMPKIIKMRTWDYPSGYPMLTQVQYCVRSE